MSKMLMLLGSIVAMGMVCLAPDDSQAGGSVAVDPFVLPEGCTDETETTYRDPQGAVLYKPGHQPGLGDSSVGETEDETEDETDGTDDFVFGGDDGSTEDSGLSQAEVDGTVGRP